MTLAKQMAPIAGHDCGTTRTVRTPGLGFISNQPLNAVSLATMERLLPPLNCRAFEDPTSRMPTMKMSATTVDCLVSPEKFGRNISPSPLRNTSTARTQQEQIPARGNLSRTTVVGTTYGSCWVLSRADARV
jgi:hypothetical protein